jgi:hypothetical protein
MNGARAAPVSVIRYQLIQRTAGTATGSRNEAVAGPNVQLVRRELNPRDHTADLTPQRAILDYVVSFDVDFIADTRNRAVAANPPCLTVYDDGAVVTGTQPGCFDTALAADTPERIRSAIVTLSVRTPEQDPRFPWVTRAAGDPITRYRFQATAGAARVRTLRAEIPLSSIAYLGL